MTAIQPPLYIGVNGEIGASELGLPWRDIMGEGVVGDTDLAVAQRGAGANMSVDVAPGAAWVKGDDDANAQPTYRVRSDATVNVAIAGADASKPRIDRVVARVFDSAFSGTSLTWDIEVLTGTATTGATLANLTGAAAMPNTCILLANVLVPAASSSVVTANIGDARVFSKVGGGASSAAGAEIAYDQITAPVNIGTSVGVVIAGSAHTYDGSPVIVEFCAPGVFLPTVAGDYCNFSLYDGATLVGVIAEFHDQGTTTPLSPVLARARITPTPGSHTFSIQAVAQVTTGTPRVDAGNGGVNPLPAYLRITKA